MQTLDAAVGVVDADAATFGGALQQYRYERPADGVRPRRRGGRPLRRHSLRYAGPDVYRHLGVPDLDALANGLLVLFVGLNPGVATALAQHAWAGRTNSFWKMLHASGCTDTLLAPSDDRSLPSTQRLGITNLVSRPTRSQSELSWAEMVDGTRAVHDKVCRFRPQTVCTVGKGIWDAMAAYYAASRRRRPAPAPAPAAPFSFGWQAMRVGADAIGANSSGDGWEGARVFVVPSTSGRAAAYSADFKRKLWNELGAWVQERRSGS